MNTKRSLFISARIKLTAIYSAIFFIFFWSFSGGLYVLMGKYLNGSYITQVRERHLKDHISEPFSATNVFIATTAGNVALAQLQFILLYLNGFLLILIPAATWILTGQALLPVKTAHDQEAQFVSDASHELKTPLSILLGETNVALSKPRKTKEYKEILISIEEEVKRLILLVENLLFLARISQQNTVLVNQSVDIVDLIVITINKLSSQSKAKNIHISFSPPDSAVTVEGNPTLLSQLFYNLIENAVKYTHDQGKVSVTVSKHGHRVKCKISDTGIGISTVELEKIFNRFYRVDKSRSETRGYGLGLAICRTIVEVHHGLLKVSSVFHKGTTFTVDLPVRQSQNDVSLNLKRVFQSGSS